MKHVLTLQEIATACSEYVVRKHYPASASAWDARTTVVTVKLDETIKLRSSELRTEGVISEIFVEVTPHVDEG